ncbi:phospholipase [Massilia sp. Dwa41.01b]|nr:phospholipase [Massilia sp. Dwa41.01b]QNB01501.1 phospholipase [Massilia sp. Se16.2.3]
MTRTAIAATVAGALTWTAPAQAWHGETHRRIVLDAVGYMKAHPDTTNYARLVAGVTKAGYTIDGFAKALAQAAVDVDDFQDTFICGATTGNCQPAPVWGNLKAGAYSSYWHFQNHTAGKDVHGNPFGGYDYARNAVHGDVDKIAASWLANDYLDDGPGGMDGWFGDGSKYNSYGKTEANYRLGGYSTPGMYQDFQTMPFQPIDNLAQYWFARFLAAPSAQALGFALHATDLLQPHHTWSTSGSNHTGWEEWAEDYYYSEGLNNPALVQAALGDFTPLAATAQDLRPLLRQGGSYSYANGGAVLSSTDHAVRRTAGRKMIPHAIAMVVHVLNRAALRL